MKSQKRSWEKSCDLFHLLKEFIGCCFCQIKFQALKKIFYKNLKKMANYDTIYK